MLSRGLPVRHHIVVYTHARLSHPLTSSHLQTSLRLDAAEVGAATWLSRSMVDAIVNTFDDSSDSVPMTSCQQSLVDFPDTIESVAFVVFVTSET